MPLYEYYCSDCQSKFELLLTFTASEGDDIVCARCHGPRVRKLISAVARMRSAGAAGDFYDAGGDSFDDAEGAGGCCGGGACSCHD